MIAPAIGIPDLRGDRTELGKRFRLGRVGHPGQPLDALAIGRHERARHVGIALLGTLGKILRDKAAPDDHPDAFRHRAEARFRVDDTLPAWLLFLLS